MANPLIIILPVLCGVGFLIAFWRWIIRFMLRITHSLLKLVYGCCSSVAKRRKIKHPDDFVIDTRGTEIRNDTFSGYETPSIGAVAINKITHKVPLPPQLTLFRIVCKAGIWETPYEISLLAQAVTSFSLNRVPTLKVSSTKLSLETVKMKSVHPQIFYLHGGGYIAGVPDAYIHVAGKFSKTVGAPVYLPDYRLCPESPIPRNVSDCLVSYKALCEATNGPICILGDSAGAGLTLALLQLIQKELVSGGDNSVEGKIRKPACAVMMSPNVDFTYTNESFTKNIPFDGLLTPPMLALVRKLTAPEYYNVLNKKATDDADDTRQVFKGWIFDSCEFSAMKGLKVYISASETEMLYSDSVSMVLKIREENPTNDISVTFQSFRYGIHDYPLFGEFASEYEESFQNICTFMRKGLGLEIDQVNSL